MEKVKNNPAFYDTLTGLPKWNLLKNVFDDYIWQSSYRPSAGMDRFALVYLDIDNFKYLSETYGYRACDEIIKSVAEYLVTKAENSNYVTRVTKDKFAMLFTDLPSKAELYGIIDEIINNSCNIYFEGYVFYIAMNAGIAFYPDHGRDIDSLIKKAETANYCAKKTGKDFCVYSKELKNDIIKQVQMVNMLQRGIEKEEFTLFYQPLFNLNNNEIIGAEALVRWPHPVKGYISPEVFIPVAEKSKQIYELERWIIDTALQQKEQWEREGLDHLELSINLSSKTLESVSDFQKIEKIITSHKVNYSKVIFEITETVIISQVDLAIKRLNRLKKYGIRIALDDFGTGFSSLTHILKLPIDIIKIDRSFINSISNRNKETIITQNVLSMAHDLNYRVVAEGIETQEQLDYLKKMSCELGQGYLFCKPLPSSLLYDVLVNSNRDL